MKNYIKIFLRFKNAAILCCISNVLFIPLDFILTRPYRFDFDFVAYTLLYFISFCSIILLIPFIVDYKINEENVPNLAFKTPIALCVAANLICSIDLIYNRMHIIDAYSAFLSIFVLFISIIAYIVVYIKKIKRKEPIGHIEIGGFFALFMLQTPTVLSIGVLIAQSGI